MKQITRKTKLKDHPLFKDFPQKLKNPKCFKDIEHKLAMILYSDHSHPTIKSYVKCKRCQIKLQKRREVLKELGFSGVEQYMMWRKVMDTIINKRALDLKIK